MGGERMIQQIPNMLYVSLTHGILYGINIESIK